MYLSTTISAVSCNKIKNKTPSFFFINYSNKLRVVNFISDVTCASYMDEMSCNKGCGVGSGNGKCRWRSGDERGYSRKFSTCVSDLTTCTDHMCDDRESLDILICPQDCTSKETFPFMLKKTLSRCLSYTDGFYSIVVYICSMKATNSNVFQQLQ